MGVARTKTKLPPDLLPVALALAGRVGWRRLTAARIARAAGCSEAAVLRQLGTGPALIGHWLRQVDAAMLAGGPLETGSDHDRLLELLLRRADALRPARAALRSLWREPALVIATAPIFMASQQRIISAAGQGGGIRAQALAVLVGAAWLSCLPVFLADGTDDLARTMAALDRALRQIPTI